jgi:uncharacterized protein YjdB
MSALLALVLTLTSCSDDKASVPVTGLSLDKTSLTLAQGHQEVIKAYVLPSNATDKAVTWNSTNRLVATVNTNGVVTALSPGLTVITAVTRDQGKLATCSLTVGVGVTGISLNKAAMTLAPGATEILIATVEPGDALNKTVTWMSNDTNVARVNDGLVTAVNYGSAIIFAISQDGGKTATCSVTVASEGHSGASGVQLNKTSATIETGGSETLIATVQPSNASNKNVIWSTSNAAVAAVSNGVVTALTAGAAIITVTTEDGGHTASCEVRAVDVYIAGYEYINGLSNAMLWVNGAPRNLSSLSGGGRGAANSVYVSGSISYVAGYRYDLGQNVSVARLWTNGAEQTLGKGVRNSVANSVYVSGSNIYVAGYEENEQRKRIPTLWIDGYGLDLTTSPGVGDAEAYSVYVSDNNYYVAGYEINANGVSVARLWIGGDGLTLGSPAYGACAYSVYALDDNNICVAGFENNAGGVSVAKLWINSGALDLSDVNLNAGANAVFLSDGDIYAAGYENNSGGTPVAKLWKIGDQPRLLTGGDRNAGAKGVYVSDGKAYVVGYEDDAYMRSAAKRWSNDLAQTLSDGTSSAMANSVFVR